MEQETLEAFSRGFLDAWNSQDVDRVLAVYTDDVVYLDPNSHGEVRGADALRRYLTKLFDRWRMSWSFKEGFVGADDNVATVLWHATLRPKHGRTEVEIAFWRSTPMTSSIWTRTATARSAAPTPCAATSPSSSTAGE